LKGRTTKLTVPNNLPIHRQLLQLNFSIFCNTKVKQLKTNNTLLIFLSDKIYNI
jgi:hypothetical protein